MNNPQKIIESPAMKADPQKLYPAAWPREPLNTSQIDETVVQAKESVLKNVSGCGIPVQSEDRQRDYGEIR